MKKLIFLLVAFVAVEHNALAQIGLHRNDFSVGVNGGYVMSNIGFTPKVTQQMHGGM